MSSIIWTPPGSGDPTAIELATDPTRMRLSGTAAHGGVQFDVPYVSQIDGNLWQGGCTSGLVLPAQIEHLVSLYPWEHYTVGHELKSGLAVRMYDSSDQATGQVVALAHWVASCVEDAPTLVHCQAGLNRSSLVAATAFVLLGRAPADAIALLRERRSPACLCNQAFERWLLDDLERELARP